MNSKIEDIESEYSFISVAKAQKVEHAIRMEKKRIEFAAVKAQK